MDFWVTLLFIVLFVVVMRYNKRLNDIQQKLRELDIKLKTLSPTDSNPTQTSPEPVRPDHTTATPAPAPPEAIIKTEDTTVKTQPPSGPWSIQPSTKETTKTKFRKVESNLSTRWMIWLGGITLALGGVFMVKYSIDAGLLSPAVRVSLSIVFGIALAVGGEWLRQRGRDLKFMEDAPDYIPSAVTAAGFSFVFSAIYAAFGLYQLIPALVAFMAMALTSFGATYMARFHGQFFAYLGLVGGMIVPMLISTGSGNAWALFPYILAITAGSIWIARDKQWVNVAATALVIALMWAFLWIFSQYKTGDIVPIGLFLMALGGVNAFMLSGASNGRNSDPSLNGLKASHPISRVMDLSALGMVLAMVGAVRLEHYSTIALIMAAVAFSIQAYAVRKNPEHDLHGLFATFGALFLLATWHVPDLFAVQKHMATNDPRLLPWSPIDIPGLERFLGVAIVSSIAIGGALLWQLPHMLRKGLWASVGAGFPLLVLVLAYWRIEGLNTSLEFATFSTFLAILYVGAISLLQKRDHKLPNSVVAAYATGATTALALALSMILRDAWLSFALAVEIVAIAAIWKATQVHALRHLALLFAGIVMVRLFLNDSIFDYGGKSPMPLFFNWLFYGYLLTAGLFYAAIRLFDDPARQDKLVPLLKAGVGILLIGYTTLQSRILFGKEPSLSTDPTALEAAIQAINWSAASALFMWREIKDNIPIFRAVRRVMTLVSVAGIILFGGLVGLFERDEISDILIFNLQFLLLFVPASIYALKAVMAHKAGYTRSVFFYGGVAFLTYWAWMSLEVYNAFHPYGQRQSLNTEWEMYSYSAVWLLYAIALLLAGLRLELGKARLAGLGMLGAVVLKVFLVDMSNLEGIARAASFIGLGLSLIGISFLYQRIQNSNATHIEDA